jgi:hypothetical protein
MRRTRYKLKKSVAEQVIRGDNPRVDDSQDLTHDDMFGDQERRSALDASETDESENEGAGDGNMGRTTRKSEE